MHFWCDDTASFDFSLLAIYFYFLGTNIFENGFIRHDFPVIVLFIIVLNFYNACLYLFNFGRKIMEIKLPKSKSDSVIKKGDVVKPSLVAHIINDSSLTIGISENDHTDFDTSKYENEQHQSVIFSISYKGLSATFNIKEDIVYFYINSRKIYAVTIHGNEYPFIQTLSELEEKYSVLGFCRISRNVLVNCHMIRDYTCGTRKGSYILLLKPQFKENLPKTSVQYFYITKEYLESFKEHIDKN